MAIINQQQPLGGLPRALWVTNLAPPYRLPVWRALASRFDLTVGLLENSERLAKDSGANRGADWARNVVAGARVHEYRTLRACRGEDRHYGFVLPDGARDLARSDVVLLGGWDSPAYFQLLAQARLTGKATVGFHESTLDSQSRQDGLVAAARSAFFRQLDRVVVPGPAAEAAILAMGVEPARIVVGFNAVDMDVFQRAKPSGEHTGHRFLYVGQLIARKNVDTLLRAFASICAADDRLTLVGRGELRESLGALAAELDLTGQVDFVDYVPNAELPSCMAEHDTLVLNSHVEVWGLVVNEALAAGMQVVVTRNCGVAASVEGMPGVHLAAADASDLETALRQAKSIWTGRIIDPPILRRTPEEFAGSFVRAFYEALEAHHKEQ